MSLLEVSLYATFFYQIHDQLSRDVADVSSIHTESLHHIVAVKSDAMQRLLISVCFANAASAEIKSVLRSVL